MTALQDFITFIVDELYEPLVEALELLDFMTISLIWGNTSIHLSVLLGGILTVLLIIWCVTLPIKLLNRLINLPKRL